MLAYNSAVQESTKETPSMMMFGHETMLPIDLVMPDLSQIQFKNAQDYVLQLQNRLYQIQSRARVNLKAAAEKQAKMYNNRLKYQDFELGSQVYYYYPVKSQNVSKENFLKWKGPYKVITKVSDTLYRIQSTAKGKPFVVHHNKLKPAHIRSELISVLDRATTQAVRPRRSTRAPDMYGDWHVA